MALTTTVSLVMLTRTSAFDEADLLRSQTLALSPLPLVFSTDRPSRPDYTPSSSRTTGTFPTSPRSGARSSLKSFAAFLRTFLAVTLAVVTSLSARSTFVCAPTVRCKTPPAQLGARPARAPLWTRSTCAKACARSTRCLAASLGSIKQLNGTGALLDER